MLRRLGRFLLTAGAILGFLFGARGAHAYLSYIPLNGGFERCDASGSPVNWSLLAAASSDGMKTTASLTDSCYRGSKGLYLESQGTGTALASIRVQTEYSFLRMLHLGAAEFYYKVVSSAAGGRNLLFRLELLDKDERVVAGVEYSPPPSHLGDGAWHRHSFRVNITESRTAKYMVISFGVNAGEEKAPGAWLVDELQIYEAPASLKLGTISCHKALVKVGEVFQVSFNLTNQGGAFYYDLRARIELPRGLQLASGEAEKTLGVIEPGFNYEMSWSLYADRPGVYPVSISSFSASDPSFSSPPMVAVLAAAEISHPQHRPDRARCLAGEAEIVLENPVLRLVFPCAETGYGLFAVQCWDGSWRDMAVAVPLAHALYLADSGRKDLLLLTPTSYRFGPSSSGAWLLLQGSIIDEDGVTWYVECRFDVGEAAPYVNVTLSVQTSAKRSLLRLSGPQILAGEASFGSSRDVGLLCGLEYLLAGERSSGTEFVRPPSNLRVVPHPLKITVPLMAIEQANCTVALSWDPLQKWDGTNSLPSAKYVSPNWKQNQSNHFMGLFIPTVPEWVKENEEEAGKPYDLQSTITLSFEIFARSGTGAIGSLLWWLEEHGVPSPPEKPRSYEETIELCTRCFKDVCWVPPAKAWKHTYLDDPGWIFWDPLVALPLWHQSAFTFNQALRESIRDQVLDALAATGGWGVDMDLALHLGELDKALTNAYNYVQSLVDSQSEDGSWPFTPDKSHEVLGRWGDTSSGWTASKAIFLLKFGRITGDAEAISSGLRALRYLDTQSRPEGAQTWELQLHVPDVLASSLVTGCYLEAYKITREGRYLDKARYWALTGLPFIYLWNPPNRPIMRYGSIPVFGASWFETAWFGNIVQWNGLDYAYKLYDLSRYDASLPWRRIAEGITVCAMQMQRHSGGPHSEFLGMYPDAYSAVKGEDAYYFDINPRLISLCAFALMGNDETTQTEILSIGGGRIHISTVGMVGNATYQDGTLSFDVCYAPGDTSYAIVGCLSKPSLVLLNGTQLDEMQDLSTVSQGWTYRADGLLVIKILHSQGERVQIRGVAYKPGMRFAQEPVWEFESGDVGGWTNANMMVPFSIENGMLLSRSTGPDPYMIGPRIQIEARGDAVLMVRMKVSCGQYAQVFWIRKDSGYYSESKSIVFPIKADGEFHEYVVKVGESPEWIGTITQIRLDPTDAVDSIVGIDYIRIGEGGLVVSFGLLAAVLARRVGSG